MFTHVSPVQNQRKPEGVLDSLELKLQEAVSHQAGPGKRTQVVCRNKKCSYPLSHVSSPERCILDEDITSLNVTRQTS